MIALQTRTTMCWIVGKNMRNLTTVLKMLEDQAYLTNKF